MTHTNNAVHVSGMWLAPASFLMIAVLALHGPLAPSLTDQMAGIADGGMRWAVVHWMAAGALSLYAVAGLIVLTAGSRLTKSRWTLSAWAVVPVGALWTVVTAVAEATVVADAAASGSLETYAVWWAFSEGMANGFVILALAVAVIATDAARSSERVTPAWSAWVGTFAGVASFSGWALGMWFGVGLGNLLWVVSSITMSVWTLWFGVGLMRGRLEVSEESRSRSPGMQTA